MLSKPYYCSFRVRVGVCVAVFLLAIGQAGMGQVTSHKKDADKKNANLDTFTAAPLDSGFGPLDTTPPATPPAQIIQQFATKESLFRRALDNYSFRRSVKVQTLEDNKVDGEYQEVDEVSFDSTGRRFEKAVYAPESTLERISMSPADFADIQQRLPFVLTSEDIGQYIVTYKGKQKVDELDTYVFDVGPKEIVKGHRYFLGRIWVDQQDMQIVLTSGKNVPDDTRKGHEDLSPPFTTYREQIDGKYWFPVYTKGEGELHFAGGNGYLSSDVHIRQILKYTDYKQFRSTIKLIYDGQDITNKGKDGDHDGGQGAKDQPDPPEPPAPASPPN
jgi:hypothetical protein